MGQVQAGSYVQYLTDYARGIGYKLEDQVSDILAPRVPVMVSIGKYKQFDDKNAFQTYETHRALGGPAKRMEFNASDGSFNCTPQALEIPIDDDERPRNADGTLADQLGIEQKKIKTVVVGARRSRAKKVFDKAATVSAAATPAWSTPSSGNPISDMNEQIEALVTATGMWPSHVVMGVTAWRYFVQHDKVADKFKSGVVSPATVRAASLLLAPGIEWVVTPMVVDTAKPGQTKSTAQIYGANIFIILTTPDATEYDPSFMKTFERNYGGVDAVREYRDESCRSDIYAVDWSEEVKVTSTLSVKRIIVS